MTHKLALLLDDAWTAGYTVKTEPGGTLVYKRVKVNAHATRAVGIWLAEDGTAFRLGIDLSVASGVRSYKMMRRILGI
jgi:hypothetical protein